MRKDLQIFADENYAAASTRLVSGTQKLAQRAILELLTELGSMTYLPHRGTEFLHACREGMTEFDIICAFSVARIRIKKLFRAEESVETPYDERFTSMQLDEIILGDDTLTLVITVRSRAGLAVQVVTPPIPLQ